MPSNVIEDCHIQTTDGSYGDWLIEQGIPTPDNVTVEPSVTHGMAKPSELEICKIMQNQDMATGPLDKV